MTTNIIRAIAVLLSLATFARAGAIERTAVFTSGADGYHTYRIPSVIVTKSGALLAFAEGRKTGGGDSGDIDLLLKRSTDGGKTFGAQQIVWNDADNTCGNPCPVVDQKTGRILLLMTHNLGSDTEKTIKLRTARGTRTVWLTTSDDDGLTWSKPREISREVKRPEWTWYATGPGVGIQLTHGGADGAGDHAGRLVIPCDYVAGPEGANGNSHVIYSDDAGLSWHIGGEPPKKEFNESQVVELSDGRLMLNMRNHRPALTPTTPRQRGVAISTDGGITFQEARRDPALVEPICQASILRFDEKRILFANPASEKREKMTVRVSEDDGATWKSSTEIYAGPSAYSCLVALPDETVGLLYECGTKKAYERIELARFKLTD
ncbi:MAG: sialidase [Phycisphaerales bacterium]|nr:sialidase [Phycisphaerales bacterium]